MVGTATTEWLYTGTNTRLQELLEELKEEHPTNANPLLAPKHRLFAYHHAAKEDLIERVNKRRRMQFTSQTPIIGIGQPHLTPNAIDNIYELIMSFRGEYNLPSGDVQFVIAGDLEPECYTVSRKGATSAREHLRVLNTSEVIVAQHLLLTVGSKYDAHSIADVVVAGVDYWLDPFPPPETASSPLGLFAMKHGVPQWTRIGGPDDTIEGRVLYGKAPHNIRTARDNELYQQEQLCALHRSWEQLKLVLHEHANTYEEQMRRAFEGVAQLTPHYETTPVLPATKLRATG